jgi:hypothetical protein
MKIKFLLIVCLCLLILTVSLKAQNKTFENQYLKVNLVAGWTAKAVSNTSGAVNITKGNYILYVSTQTSQASGVEGGRFAEISMGAKSADAVNVAPPAPECGTRKETKVNPKLLRSDLFVSSKEKHEYCRTPANGKNVWYFSYLTTSKSAGYFNYYRIQKNTSLLLADLRETPSEEFGENDTGWVITMAYNSKNINSFPEKDGSGLKTALNQMSLMVNSLKIKH